MGVVHPQLKNVYFLGYTRPMIGGSPNISEMQALFIHKLITQPDFHRRIHRNLKDRIASYNGFYYGDTPPGARDHVVYYGFYNDELARLIGIDHRPEHIQSLSDLLFYYVFPNDAFKYRIKGEYAVDGVDDLCRRINGEYGGFILPMAFFLTGIAEEPCQTLAVAAADLPSHSQRHAAQGAVSALPGTLCAGLSPGHRHDGCQGPPTRNGTLWRSGLHTLGANSRGTFLLQPRASSTSP